MQIHAYPDIRKAINIKSTITQTSNNLNTCLLPVYTDIKRAILQVHLYKHQKGHQHQTSHLSYIPFSYQGGKSYIAQISIAVGIIIDQFQFLKPV